MPTKKLFSLLFLIVTMNCSCNKLSEKQNDQDNKVPKIPYPKLVEQIENQRECLKTQYDRAKTDKARYRVIKSSQDLIFHSINELSKYWIGTKWDFNGATTTPKQGVIACGYFISNLLLDSGFKFNRVKLSQQAAIKIIHTFVSKKDVHHYSNRTIKEFIGSFSKLDDGIYIIGLDRHVGILSKKAEKRVFIHSSYYSPYSVVREELDVKSPLSDSKYRVIGNILNKRSIIKWLKGDIFRVAR